MTGTGCVLEPVVSNEAEAQRLGCFLSRFELKQNSPQCRWVTLTAG
jgi:hypothetical protein